MPQILLGQTRRPKTQVVRLADDHFELITERPDRFRVLQITDTHMGSPWAEERVGDTMTRKSIRSLIDEHQPDFVFHTGDFINNDKENVEHGAAVAFMNDLGTPWSLVWGNHDHSDQQVGAWTLDDTYRRLENHAIGFHKRPDGGRDYCFRLDVRGAKTSPVATLIGFNTGGGETPKVVSASQLAWFEAQLESDRRRGWGHPILVMQHIPLVEYKTVFDAHAAVGRQGEGVCYEVDHGTVFPIYRASGRVRGVFCGHDHVNDYTGLQEGVRLTYGRVSGWSGYGDWQRGGRLIELAGEGHPFRTRVVIPSRAEEKPDWRKTFDWS